MLYVNLGLKLVHMNRLIPMPCYGKGRRVCSDALSQSTLLTLWFKHDISRNDVASDRRSFVAQQCHECPVSDSLCLWDVGNWYCLLEVCPHLFFNYASPIDRILRT